MPNPYVRQIQIDQIAEKMTDATQKEIIRNYRASLKAIKQQMADLYERYEKNGILTYAEMARYNRIDGMFKGINKELYALTGTNMRQTKRLASDVFQESYYRTAFVFEEAMQANLSFSLIDPKVIQASVENPISGLTLNETLQKNRVNIIRDIKQTVTQGLIQGSSYKKMADRLTTTFEGDAVKANRVVRTEAHRNKEAGSLAAAKHAKDLGVEFEVIWIAILDDRTRDQHGAMDGQVATNKPDGTWEFVFPDGLKTPAPGMSGYAHQDINCRCSTAKYPFGFLPKARRVEGEIREYQTYDEWAEEKGIKKKASLKADSNIDDVVIKEKRAYAKVPTREESIDSIMNSKSVKALPKEYREVLRNQLDNADDKALKIASEGMKKTKIKIHQKDGNIGSHYSSKESMVNLTLNESEVKAQIDVFWHEMAHAFDFQYRKGINGAAGRFSRVSKKSFATKGNNITSRYSKKYEKVSKSDVDKYLKNIGDKFYVDGSGAIIYRETGKAAGYVGHRANNAFYTQNYNEMNALSRSINTYKKTTIGDFRSQFSDREISAVYDVLDGHTEGSMGLVHITGGHGKEYYWSDTQNSIIEGWAEYFSGKMGNQNISNGIAKLTPGADEVFTEALDNLYNNIYGG